MKTEIPVTIYTGYEYAEGDCVTNHRQQIEKLGFYLESVFNLLKKSAESAEVEARGNYELLTFLADVQHLSEVGFGLATSIFRPVSELESAVKPLSIAEQISNLITSPDVPNEISEAIEKAVLSLRSKRLMEETVNKERSAEFIAEVLREAKENE